MPTPPRVADVFDSLAPTYDQTGVPFFRPVGARLVDPRTAAGERALDIGCGRGAVTVPLAAGGRAGGLGARGGRVRPHGVATRALVEVRAGAGVRRGGGRRRPRSAWTVRPYHRVAGAVLPARPGGGTVRLAGAAGRRRRLGITTFGRLDDATLRSTTCSALRAAGSARPASVARSRSFENADATRALFETAASRRQLVRRRSRCRSRTSRPGSASRVRRAQSVMWRRVPDADLPRVRARAAEILDGPLAWEIRFWVAGR